MPPIKRLATHLGLTLAAGAFVLGVFYVFGMLFGIGARVAAPDYDPETVAAVERDRDTSFDPDNLPVLHRAVDYSAGESAPWFPRGDPPLLAGLVERGRIEPVAERTGPEPAVVEGVEGIGNYGGTWYRVATSDGDVGVVSWRIAGGHLLRWSPLGYPLVPHLARDWEVSDDRRAYTVHLRRGARWSDGHPFTADDILYWWEHEVQHFEQRPPWMVIRGELGEVEKVDRYTVRFIFPQPNGTFPERMAKHDFWAPKHYLKPFHPEIGDPEMREKMMRVQGIRSPRSAYFRLKNDRNPDHPRMWPWVPRSYHRTPPYEFVRNPYYYAVDTEGNQLPYLDRVLFDLRSEGMISVTAAAGDISMQLRHIRYDDYTLYMEQREANNYDVYHWFQGSRSVFCVFPNLNRRVDPDRPATRWKNKLLNDPRFRQALSLAIDRREIIVADYDGLAEPAQLDPGRESIFHHPPLFHSFTDHDPDRAGALLDDIGLTGRDAEGYRTFPDGTRMAFYLHVTDYTGTGPSEFLIDHWGRVGVRVILQERARSLWTRQLYGLEHDLSVWMGESEFYPLVEPRNFVPVGGWSLNAPGYGTWYAFGGLYGHPEADERPLALEPPEDHPVRRSMTILDAALAAEDLEEQSRIFREVLDIAAENVWTINISTPPPQLVIVQDGFRNVPRTAIVGHIFNTPANAGLDTYYFDDPRDSPGAIVQMERSMIEIRSDPTLSINAGADDGAQNAGFAAGSLIRYLIYGILIAGAILIAVRHPFIGRRCIILVPTLLVISVATYVIIQLPPGDYIQARILELEMEGDEGAIQEIEQLRELFHLDDPTVVRYIRWLGLPWFLSFESPDKGLLQGHLGRSMEDSRPVNQVVGDRILLTFLISLFTVIFTWALAIPIGIFSAVRQYSIGDYIFTVIGFLGMCIPNFLLALILMYVSAAAFDTQVSGLFSPEYAAQPEWTWGKFVDLMQHIWVPVVVIGTAGTAWMIRVMRGNLLDELRKPYVTTARAKGVRPAKLILKYPVRLALNPFISGIGQIFPQLVSGGAIVAIVLSLPTVGPLLLSALMTQDMYLAGSMLMVLSLLTVLGTLVSDLLLLWVDPRIRMGGAE